MIETMNYYIMLLLLPGLLLAAAFLWMFSKKLKRPRYIKDESFLRMEEETGATSIEHKGFVVNQSSYNKHVTIERNNGLVYHARCTKKLSEKELKELVNRYITLYANSNYVIFDSIKEDDIK